LVTRRTAAAKARVFVAALLRRELTSEFARELRRARASQHFDWLVVQAADPVPQPLF
jgi:hypothetical protein